MFATEFLADAEAEPISEDSQMELQYACCARSKERDEHFLNDYLAFDQLNAYQQDLDADAKAAVRRFKFGFDERPLSAFWRNVR